LQQSSSKAYKKDLDIRLKYNLKRMLKNVPFPLEKYATAITFPTTALKINTTIAFLAQTALVVAFILI
jgi:hypothetical protein